MSSAKIKLAIVIGLACSPARSSNCSTSYDPLALAIAEVEASGYPIPDGWEVTEAGPGELGDIPGKTFPDDMEIKIDVTSMINALDDHGSIAPEGIVGSIAVIVRHELHHTAEYGVPTTHPGGYSNGLCAHTELADDDLAYYCTLTSETGDPSARAAMCSHRKACADKLDSLAPLRNANCPGGPFGPTPSCPACD